MRNLIVGTVILLTAVIAVTVFYFKNLDAPGGNPERVMGVIPNTAALIFEFDNDDGFYQMFADNEVLDDVCGEQKLADLAALRAKLLGNFELKQFFAGQKVFLSIHGTTSETVDFLLTIAAGGEFKDEMLDKLASQYKNGLRITKLTLAGKAVYQILLEKENKTFYLANQGNHIFSGSFSKDLVAQAAAYQPAKSKQEFKQIPAQKNANALANLYVNYKQLNPLFEQFFQTRNPAVFRSFRAMPATAALTLSYKRDALMFNGFSEIPKDAAASYLSIFVNQKPVEPRLGKLFPSTTAWVNSFALSDVPRFAADLDTYHKKAGVEPEKAALLKQIKAETGLNLRTEFNKTLGNEFALAVTRFDEKYAIISVKDGSALRPLMVNISTMATDDIGQFKHARVPYFLLGDTFSSVDRPYFMILDNYLILSNSIKELDSYRDSYFNQKLLVKTESYSQFSSFLSERSNVAFFLQFRNMFPLLRRDAKPGFRDITDPDGKRWGKFYGLSYQLTASDRTFYTNFVMRLAKTDTTETP